MLKKKSNKIQILAIFSLFFLLQFSVILAYHNYSLDSGENILQHENQPNFKIKTSSYNNVGPFIIDDNGGGDYTWVQLEGNFSWCTGNGTINNPYIINRIAINGMNSSSCIEIKFSLTSYFVIKNSLFYNSSDNNQDAGIEFFSVRYGLLENNTCINNNAHGFYGWGCDNTTFFQNNFSYNALNGIYLFSGSDDNQISENKVSFNQNYGIYFHSSNLNTINDNQIEYNDNVGIRLYFAENTTITSNIIYENDEEGIMNYQGSHYTTICGNNVSDNMGDGVYLFLSNNLDVSNNSINHNNNGIWSAQIENMTIMNNTITDNSGSGFLGTTSMKNCDIIGNNFSSNYDNGIIMYIGEDCEIRDNYIFKNGDFTSDHGIELWNFENGEISNNHILESFGYGLNIKTGSQNIIKENQISENNGYGLYIEYGSQNLFNGNNITENQNHGIFIYGNIVTDISANNSIDGNRIYKNNGYGIYLVNIQFLPSDSNISDNTITKNSGGAIYIERSTGNIIKGNIMISNANYGMRLYSVERCVIEDNIFENHSLTAFYLQNGTENSINYNIITNSSFGMSIYTDSHDNEI
ncbi:MAG: hypothetical protein GF317_18870, partial [Candidatus Lokiarchaeota archaeon]|nr:hypothetical protein [Candidatus Lokiarchaeota archaeon]MBD3201581.1 hypothetical protein [Candidatus Lokiarchaeota archaeon]